MWTFVRALHLLAMAFFVGGQVMLAAVVVPAVRRHGTDAAMRAAARRFGVGSGIALAVLVLTGSMMAGHFDRWSDPLLHAKLAGLVLIVVLVGIHAARPRMHVLSALIGLASLAVAYLGVALAHG